MNSKTTDNFWRLFDTLPKEIQAHANRSYAIWSENPAHPGLKFKKIFDAENMWSVRIGIHYRALGLREDDEISWFWIGSHADYDKILNKERI